MSMMRWKYFYYRAYCKSLHLFYFNNSFFTAVRLTTLHRNCQSFPHMYSQICHIYRCGRECHNTTRVVSQTVTMPKVWLLFLSTNLYPRTQIYLSLKGFGSRVSSPCCFLDHLIAGYILHFHCPTLRCWRLGLKINRRKTSLHLPWLFDICI